MMGQTALLDAVTIGHRDVVSLLIEHGADVSLVSKVEVQHDQTDMDPPGSSLSPIEIACSSGNLDIIELLLNSGAEDVDHRCLSSAILADNIDVIRILLQQGKESIAIETAS